MNPTIDILLRLLDGRTLQASVPVSIWRGGRDACISYCGYRLSDVDGLERA